jgi:hypothetical protein
VQLRPGGTGEAVVTASRCSGAKTGCTIVDRVYRTSDGGRSWAR